MCRNGRYTERGIKERNGYGAERFRVEPDFAVKIEPALGILGVLLEPASILAKAWDHTERIGHRARAWQPRTLLVTGAGPIGLLAALMGMQRGLDVHVLDHNKGGPKEAIVRDLGATYHSDASSLDRLAPDVLMECTGAPAVIRDCLGVRRPPPGSSASPASPSPASAATSISAASTATWCSTTTSCSAPSTPTAGTTNWRRTRLRAPTSAGSDG